MLPPACPTGRRIPGRLGREVLFLEAFLENLEGMAATVSKAAAVPPTGDPRTVELQALPMGRRRVGAVGRAGGGGAPAAFRASKAP